MTLCEIWERTVTETASGKKKETVFECLSVQTLLLLLTWILEEWKGFQPKEILLFLFYPPG